MAGLLGLLSLGLSACTTPAENDPSLALACQTRPCVCTPESPALFGGKETVALRWKQNGDAYCPDGYVLRLSDDEGT